MLRLQPTILSAVRVHSTSFISDPFQTQNDSWLNCESDGRLGSDEFRSPAIRPSWQTLFHNAQVNARSDLLNLEELVRLKDRSQATDGTDGGVAAEHAMKCLQ